MISLDEYLKLEPYSLSKDKKREILVDWLNRLTKHHTKNSTEYSSIIEAFGMQGKEFKSLEEFLFLPVRLFKEYELKSCRDDEVVKVLTSSGTTSSRVSKIFLDKETSILQTKTLVKIMQNFLGKKRLPMLIVDSKSIFKDRRSFSARGAGILGLSNFGRDHTYLLDENMEIDLDAIEDFLQRHKGEEILMFGFTFMVWQYLYEVAKSKNIKLNLSNVTLIHSGGWKKLQEKAVSNELFKSSLKKQFNIDRVHDFYGMVEQVGSIFVECKEGFLHTPIFSDIIVRDKISLKPLPFGKEGVVEVVSILPQSYPGHILLTEDIGVVFGEDDCPCGRKGRYFKIRGRLPKAELRGCSDTHAYSREMES
jgi:phenylacetate-coenzyme A ligase PaaK-like adenylate-forming protein